MEATTAKRKVAFSGMQLMIVAISHQVLVLDFLYNIKSLLEYVICIAHVLEINNIFT